MKILRLSTFLDFGGIESKMVNLSSNQDDNDWVFVSIGKGGEAEKKIKAKGKRAIALQYNYKIPSILTIWKLFLFLRKEKPDVIHSSGAEANFFGFIAGILAGIPKIVVEEIGIPNHSAKAKKIFRFVFRQANWAVGESQLVVDHISNSFGLDPTKTKVLHNFGVFDYDFSKLERSTTPNTFHIIMISRLEPVKNIEGVLKVLARLKKEGIRNVKLTIAGNGTSEVSLKQKVKDLVLEQQVEFLGFIDDPYPHLLNADLYILNSFSEGFSNSLVEAMYSKTISLSTAVGASPEIIEDHVNGFLIPADDEEALYIKLLIIIGMSKDQRRKIAMAGHTKIVNNFTLEKHVSELMKIYKN